MISADRRDGEAASFRTQARRRAGSAIRISTAGNCASRCAAPPISTHAVNMHDSDVQNKQRTVPEFFDGAGRTTPLSFGKQNRPPLALEPNPARRLDRALHSKRKSQYHDDQIEQPEWKQEHQPHNRERHHAQHRCEKGHVEISAQWAGGLSTSAPPAAAGRARWTVPNTNQRPRSGFPCARATGGARTGARKSFRDRAGRRPDAIIAASPFQQNSCTFRRRR